MRVLLDTCVILWLSSERERLSSAGARAIRSASIAYVSPVSAWEIGLKVTRERIVLPEPLESWWFRVMETHDLIEMPLQAAAVIRSMLLPAIHSDPADRFLIATAMEHDLVLTTPDEVIRRYPGVATSW